MHFGENYIIILVLFYFLLWEEFNNKSQILDPENYIQGISKKI